MKRAIIYSVMILLSAAASAQVPGSFSYQAIVRDISNNPVQDQDVSFEMIILKGSISGSEEYKEYHSVKTNDLGLVNLAIGNGTGKKGDISAIDWGADIYFLRVNIDITGGATYVEMGTTQLLSVPYAMHAKTSESFTETQTIADAAALGNLVNTQLKNLTDPTDTQDAATKAYVDALLERIEALEGGNFFPNGFTDPRDGNHYNVVQIGYKFWMAENLKYLPSVAGPGTGSKSDPCYYVYGYYGTEYASDPSLVYVISMSSSAGSVTHGLSYKDLGFSVRCIKD